MSDQSSIPEQIQALIRSEADRLNNKRKELEESLWHNRKEINALQKQCSHPNATRGEDHGCPTLDCPDCGYGAIYIIFDRPTRKGRKSKKE